MLSYSVPAKQSSLLRVGIVGFTLATHGLILGTHSWCMDMVRRSWVIGSAHGIGVSRQAHRRLIHFGWREVRQLSKIDLVVAVVALNRLAVDLQTLVLPKENFTE